jgi:hypothetical protein
MDVVQVLPQLPSGAGEEVGCINFGKGGGWRAPEPWGARFDVTATTWGAAGPPPAGLPTSIHCQFSLLIRTLNTVILPLLKLLPYVRAATGGSCLPAHKAGMDFAVFFYHQYTHHYSQ